MQAEVIAIGDELTSGQRLDTNSQWISRRLADLGIRVLYHTTVGDELAANVGVFRHAVDRADLVISTGGLGPTADDLTREAIAQAIGAELILKQEAVEHIKRLFARFGRAMPERNVVQAMFPNGSRMIPNPNGTAPGIDTDISRASQKPARLFALPGVPGEMRDMWEATVEPAIVTSLGPDRRFIRHRVINCFGAGESDVERMLPDLVRRGRTPRVGITASKADIMLRITAEGSTPEACGELMEPTAAIIRECLGKLVFGEDEDQLQDVVIRMLKQRQQTLATVECDSGGVLAQWLSEADPDGDTYLGGFVARHSAAMAEAAGMERAQFLEGAVEPRTLVQEMAIHCRQQHVADYALALGPFPDSDDDEPTSRKFHFALASPAGATAKSARFAGHPDIRKPRAVKQALNLLRLDLL
jgi:nicotinamide-nucleotide amidase